MHKFKITYMDLQDVKNNVVVFANTQEDAFQRIFSLKTVVRIKDCGAVFEPPQFLKYIFKLERLSARELADILRQLAYTKQAGLSMTSSFESLVTMGSKKQVLFCSKVLENLKAGKSLAEAIQQIEYMLPLKISNIIKTSSDSGNLYEVLMELADQLENNISISNKVRTAMIYPTIVLIVAIAVTFFLFTEIIPEVASILRNLGSSDLPLITQVILDIGKFMQSYGLLLLLGIFLLYAVYRIIVYKRHMEFKARVAAKAPLIGRVVVAGEMSKFYNHFAFLLKAGFPVDSALLSASNVVNNLYIAQCLHKSYDSLHRGFSVAEALKNSGLPSNMHLQLLSTGATSGKLIDVCQTLAQQHSDETERRINSLLKILEPAIMLLVGGIVGIIMIAVYQPLFEMMTVI